jgi:hypothetical protein
VIFAKRRVKERDSLHSSALAVPAYTEDLIDIVPVQGHKLMSRARGVWHVRLRLP